MDGPYRRLRPLPWRCLRVGARDAGSFRTRRTRRACRAGTYRRLAAVLVSIGCSVAFNDAPRALIARTMSCRSPMAALHSKERARTVSSISVATIEAGAPETEHATSRSKMIFKVYG